MANCPAVSMRLGKGRVSSETLPSVQDYNSTLGGEEINALFKDRPVSLLLGVPQPDTIHDHPSGCETLFPLVRRNRPLVVY